MKITTSPTTNHYISDDYDLLLECSTDGTGHSHANECKQSMYTKYTILKDGEFWGEYTVVEKWVGFSNRPPLQSDGLITGIIGGNFTVGDIANAKNIVYAIQSACSL